MNAMRDLWYLIFWKRDTQADRVNSAFRRGFALGFLLALLTIGWTTKAPAETIGAGGFQPVQPLTLPRCSVTYTAF